MAASITVLHVVDDLEAPGGGLARATVTGVLPSLKEEGFEPALVVLRRAGEAGARLRKSGVEVLEVGASPLTLVPKLGTVSSWARERGAALIHSHSPFGALAAVTVSGRLDVPLVVSAYRDVSAVPKLDRALLWYGLRPGLAAVVVPGEVVAESVRRFAPHLAPLITVLPAGPDWPRIEATPTMDVRAEGGLPPGAPIVVYVGPLADGSGVDVLIEAWAQVVKHEPASLLLVGDGPNRNAFEKQAMKLDLGHSVFVAGLRDDVPSILKGCDVFVLPAQVDQGDEAAVEAMAVGLPAVLSDVGRLRELSEEGSAAVLVPAGNAGALADALRGLVADEAMRQGFAEAGRRSVHDRFPPGQAARGLAELYRRVLKPE